MSSWKSQIDTIELIAKSDIQNPNNASLEVIINGFVTQIESYTGLDFDDDVEVEVTKKIRKTALKNRDYNPKLFQIGAWQSIESVKYYTSQLDQNPRDLTFRDVKYNFHREGLKETNIINEIESLSRPSFFREHAFLEITGKAGYSKDIKENFESALVFALNFYGNLQGGKNIKSERDLTSTYTYGDSGLSNSDIDTDILKLPGVKSLLDPYKIIKNYTH